MPILTDPLTLSTGAVLQNRFALAPLTNQQSHEDGTASAHDLHWFEQLAAGGYSLLTTAAANVQPTGKSFAGQLGIYDDRHIPGLAAMADIAHRHGILTSVQLHHGGAFARQDLIGSETLVGPSDGENAGARALTLLEAEQLRDDFIAAAGRAQRAGFDGIELHGAFGFILSAFLSPETNRRTDHYGGNPDGRSRLLREIIQGIRAACGPGFHIGLRLALSGQDPHLPELRDMVADFLERGQVDYLDLVIRSLGTRVEVGPHTGELLVEIFTDLPRASTKVGVSGDVMSSAGAQRALDHGSDFVFVASGAVVHHDFPQRALADHAYETPRPPLPASFFRDQGRSPAFVDYLQESLGFVEAH
ncbi:NADH:flavin oxidoreductase [Arthrobacter sp. StoSoilB13]|uniref:NADH:flavin oxidoreductase n=1 Tax=Arthrobacter sp. StoSoilB13 TaxID=2830993 RepID=UPI001CC5F62E|nr:NADH:flavin oxidoreductase [Arthrobacter sp. StoSoilB13]BCW50842.1 putative NADH-dependent flavin oxidoreductase YqiG [Arthrobacter sp. StoSoilB13]